MTVCSYYLRGICKYGDRCRNEHPGGSGNFGNQTWTSNNNRVAVPYTIETMIADITPLKDKPLWPLSSYGPAKHEPVIISGLDESPEELRLKAVTTLKAGSSDKYTQYEGQKTTAADQAYVNARDNVRQLYEQALKASAQVQASSSGSSPSVTALTTTAPSVFGTGSMPSAFGNAATTASGKPPFGQPAFGQTGFGASTSGASAFGQSTQTSAFGAPAPAFGRPTQPNSAFGQSSAFGATTQSTSASTLAQPSTQPTSVFGKPSQPTLIFGQPSQPSSAFGQPSQLTSTFAQPSQPTSALSQPSQSSSAFGQPSQPAFGQSSLIKPGSGAFGGPAGCGFSAFASQPSTFTSAAASSSSPTGTILGQSAFGSAPSVQSAFGSVSSAPRSAFGVSQPTQFGTTSFSTTLSALPSPASAVGSSSPFATSPMTVTPSSDKPASGVPDFTGAKLAARMKPGADRYLDLLPNDYEEMIPADVKAAFTGTKFEWGKIPDWIPPAGVRG